MVFGTFGTAATQWLLVWLFARFAGPSASGAYALSLSIATPVFLLASLGLRNVYLTYAAVPAPRFAAYLFVRVSTTVLAALVLGVVSWSLGLDPALTRAMCVMKSLDAVADLLAGWIQNRERMLTLGVLMAARPLVTAAAVWAALVASGRPDALVGLWAVAAVNLVVCAVMALLVWRTVRAARPGLPAPTAPTAPTGASPVAHHTGPVTLLAVMRGPLAASVPMTAAQMLSALLSYVPLWWCQVLGGQSAVGIFSGAAYVVTAAHLAGASAQTLVLPGYRAAPALAWARSRRLGRRLLLVGLIAAVVIVVLGDRVLRFVYGPAFGVGPAALVWLAVAVAFTAPAYVVGSSLMAANRYTTQMSAGLVAMGASVATGAIGSVVMSAVGPTGPAALPWALGVAAMVSAAGALARFCWFFAYGRPRPAVALSPVIDLRHS